MSNGYILDITGKVKKKVDDSYTDIDLNKKADFENFQNKNNFNKEQDSTSNNDTYLGNYLKEIGPDKFSTSPNIEVFLGVDGIATRGAVQTINNTTPSFGFYDEDGSVLDEIQQTAFRRFNSYLDVNDNNEVIPFVDEFEFYTGYRAIQNDAEGFILDDVLLFIIEYFADVLIETVIIEGMILLYKTQNIGSPSKDKNFIKNQKDYSLVLGEYILEEADVFSRYFFDVLNYPIEEEHYKISSETDDLKKLANYSLKRLSCYLIGLSELISVDRLIDWKYIVSQINTNILNVSESNVTSIMMITNSILDVTLNTLTNTASLKKLMFIVKKFKTQKYWVENQLYSAKRKTYLDYIADNYNYYYFKFFIERVNVGIKIWNRYVIDDDFNTKSLSTYIQKDDNKDNRLSQEFNNENTSHMREVSYTLDDNAESAKADLINLYLSTDSDVNQDKIDEIKNNITSGKRKTAKYNFNYKLNSLAVSEIPSALMYNTSFKTNAAEYSQPTESDHKVFAKTLERYLPIELVNQIEENLESEYVPFYFHDLRTNEILSFHAFIENISDSYSPEYTSSGGFGRIDDVKAYVKTVRSISLSFLVAAMNELDHQYMWLYLNKLTSMVYPQWTKGEELIIDDLVLQQPFSQVPGNSPLIRLRIGDLIKNNYSRFNLERIFGFDDLKQPPKVGETSASLAENINKKNDLMKPFVNDSFDVNNPITQAYESRMSKGLAGHITNLDFNYADAVWETKKGSKAPMLVKVTLQFAPIHDIPPGLDYKGMSRAINYKVGDINNKLSDEDKWQ